MKGVPDTVTVADSHDLVLDGDDPIGFQGTPSASNYNTRMLLGPRVFFARTHALTAAHHHATRALLRRFALVLPLRSLSNASLLMAHALGWRLPPTVPHANRHATYRMQRARRELLELAGPLMRAHNTWDLALYGWVVDRFDAERAQMAGARPV